MTQCLTIKIIRGRIRAGDQSTFIQQRFHPDSVAFLFLAFVAGCRSEYNTLAGNKIGRLLAALNTRLHYLMEPIKEPTGGPAMHHNHQKVKEEAFEGLDAVENAYAKLRFLELFFCLGKPGEEFSLSEEAAFGFYNILSEMDDQLREARRVIGEGFKEVKHGNHD